MARAKKNQEEGAKINLRESVPLAVRRARAASVRVNVEENEEEPDFGDDSAGGIKEEEIEQGLNEIYQDDNGDLVDVHKLDKIRRRGFFLSIFNAIFLLAVLGGLSYWLYDNWYQKSSLDEKAVDFALAGDTDVVAGEEFEYEIRYKNNNRGALENAKVNIAVPKNFILRVTEPAFGATKGLWEIGRIDAGVEGSLKVKGYMLGRTGDSGVVSAYLAYSPEGFSSEYKKEAFLTSKLIDTGVDIRVEAYESMMIGETEEVLVRFRAMDKNFIDSFRMSLEPQENISILEYMPKETATKNNIPYAAFTIDRPGVWEVSGVLDDDHVVPVRLKLGDKAERQQSLRFKFERKADDGQYYEFFYKEVAFEAMKNNLNLTMILNGERSDTGVDFGETLNYSIAYDNQGDTDLKDVVIMAVLDGDYLDWTTLDDKNKGREKASTITWSKEEIPALAEIKQGQEGMIDFSIKVFPFGAVEAKGKAEIGAYAHFGIGAKAEDAEDGPKTEDPKETETNRSNTLVAKINSDMDFSESVRYFNEDNIPVGSGPNPPQVGQISSYKVYWTISNNLHELSKLAVSMKLPDGVEYDAKDRATAGSLVYSEETRELVWNVGRLPTSAYQVSAEFSIRIQPDEEDRNTIMVLLPGSKASAVDVETNETIEKMTKAKTTKLEDDEIGRSDGIVE